MKVSGKQKELADLLASFPAVKHLERCLRLHLCLLPHIPDHTVNHWEKHCNQSPTVPSIFFDPGSGVVKEFEKIVIYFDDSFHLLTRVKQLLVVCFFHSAYNIFNSRQLLRLTACRFIPMFPDVLLIQEHQENELNFQDITIGVHPTYIWLFRISCFSLVSMFRRSLKDG